MVAIQNAKVTISSTSFLTPNTRSEELARLKMPPKKPKKSISIKQDFLDSLPDDVASSSQLTSTQLSRAYGLLDPQVDSEGYENILRACPNKWLQDQPAAQAEAAVKPEVEMIVIDSSEEDNATTTKKSAKGKGKAKEKGGCCSENCGSNPRCLNWLGQAKWEDAGEPPPISTRCGQGQS